MLAPTHGQSKGTDMRVIGVDTGGTFTDTVVISGEGIGIGKALSTPPTYVDGVVASITAAAADLGEDVHAVLAGCETLSHGTTVGLNALLTGAGSPVGLLTTAGFESTVPVAKVNKALGLDPELRNRPLQWEKPDLVVPRSRILGVDERVDVAGTILRPLDEAGVRDAARTLAERGAEVIAVALLWSTVNPVHEHRVRELVLDELGDVSVTISSDVASHVGEYERTMTAVLNATIRPLVERYLASLEARLAELGFGGSFFLMQTGGGVQLAHRLAPYPVRTLNSGPVGGLAAAVRSGDELGHRRIITTDVGGTSFDVSLVVDGALQYVARPTIDRHAIATPVVDILSIGTGGGSIAWVDPALGALRVGPASAGADPGPACYGKGGDRPTVTDAAAVLGYVRHLGGTLQLDVAAAEKVIRSQVAEPLDMSLHAAADGILTVANAQMADLVRRATLQRGHDPSTFVLYAFGGAAPQYAGRYAADLGIDEVIIPAMAPVFSAYGAVASDLRSSAEAQVPAVRLADALGLVNERLAGLEAEVRGELAGVPAGSGAARIVRRIGLRFERQVNKITIELPAGTLDAGHLPIVRSWFDAEYERLVGAGTAGTDATVEVVSLEVEGSVRLPAAPGPQADGDLSGPPTRAAEREAWFDGAMVTTPVYELESLAPGAAVEGPALVEGRTTTAVVNPGQRLVVDGRGHCALEVY